MEDDSLGHDGGYHVRDPAQPEEPHAGGGEYWDLDAILADHQKLSCFFRDDVPTYGHLRGDASGSLPARSRIELPFWMASELALNEYVDVELPRCFSSRSRNDLLANPNTVELRKLCPYFYEFGMKVFGLLDERSLSKLLVDSFASRAQLIMDYTQSRVYGGLGASDAVQDRFKNYLDETELKLYRIGMAAAEAMKRWTGSDRDADLVRSDFSQTLPE
ncbi:hypothetical protein DFJ74DRAFT_686782 [Hyaloraphidium curvatum]|nr:hypothetical protein DFJ74DRAFT_686782 [Hyaloraphidium curvatum]